MNVGLVDREKAEKNVELKKKKPAYKAYEEEESVDDMVNVRSHVTFLSFHFGDHCVCQVSTWLATTRSVCKLYITL